MKLNTLNSLIDDIILTLRNSNVTESEKLSRILVELWIHNYRAFLIRLEIDKGYDINSMYLSTIPGVHLDRVEDVPGHFVFVGDVAIPKLILFHYKSGLISVKDMYGNLLLIGDETKMKYQKYRKYTCKEYICWVKNGKLYVEGDSNLVEYVTIDVIAENPADLKDCFDPDLPYPIPAHMVPTLKDLIFTKELHIMPLMPSDDSNDALDNNQNIMRDGK